MISAMAKNLIRSILAIANGQKMESFFQMITAALAPVFSKDHVASVMHLNLLYGELDGKEAKLVRSLLKRPLAI